MPLRGKVNLGLNGVTYYALFYPFINAWKCGDNLEIKAATGGGGAIEQYFSQTAPGFGLSPWGTYLDANGDLVDPLPADFSQLIRVFFAHGSPILPDFNRIGEQWVLRWTGTATTVSITGVSSSVRDGNRIDWVWGTNTSNMSVTFDGVDLNDPPKNIELYKLSHEALLDAGEIFNPEWLAEVQRGSGIVRFMDWQVTNSNRSTIRAADIAGMGYFTWGRENITPGIKGGMPLAVMSRLANKVQSHPWVCIPTVLGTGKLTRISTITSANPAVVTSPEHNWSNGDQVIPYYIEDGSVGASNWGTVNRNTYTVANMNAGAGTLELSGLNSTGFTAHTAYTGYLSSPYNLAAITTEVAVIAQHFLDEVDSRLCTFFEFGNEAWNSIFDVFHWLAAQARVKFLGDNNYKTQGYLAAHCMKVIRDTYGVGNRHRWKGVVASHLASATVTSDFLLGVDQYLIDESLALEVSDLFDYVAITGYWGSHNTDANKSMVFGWMDTSEQRWLDGLEPTKYSYFDRTVNEYLRSGGGDLAAGFQAAWGPHKTIASANGLGLAQYEGGNHNNAQFSSLTTEETDRFLEFYVESVHTEQDAETYTLMMEAFEQFGGVYPSKFVEMNKPTIFGSWGGLRYIGDSNPVWDAVVAFNADNTLRARKRFTLTP